MNRESENKHTSPKTRRNSEGADFNTSLDSYLSSVDRLGRVEPEVQQALMSAMDACQLELEKSLSRFGFAGLEFCRVLEECGNGGSPEDFFLCSSLRQGRETLPPKLPELLRLWHDEIKEAHAALKQAFLQGGECERLRGVMSALLRRYRPNGVLLEELFQAAAGYGRLNPDSSDQMEERFLMRGAEIRESLDSLRVLRGRLDELHAKMAESNLRLVISIAGKYRECSLPMDDIIQEGNVGLMVAIRRFDFRLGNKFSTYAGWWIKNHILRALAEQSRVVRLPLHMIQAIQNMNRAEQRFIQTEGREPDNDELAAVLEMPLARVSALRKMASQSISLQASIDSEEDGRTLEEFIAPETKNEPWRNYARNVLCEKLHEMLNTLPERERQIIVYRFGLCGESALPLGEISSRLNLSRERVRQLENKVMAQLRSREFLKFIDGLSHLD